ETVADVYYRGTPHAQAPKLEPDTHGLIWMPAIVHFRVCPCRPRAGGAFGCNPATDFSRLHPGEIAALPLEAEARVVPRCDTGPHDKSRHSALHGDSYGRSHPNRGCRSHADRDQPEYCHRSLCSSDRRDCKEREHVSTHEPSSRLRSTHLSKRSR